jgi:hypothetical protein
MLLSRQGEVLTLTLLLAGAPLLTASPPAKHTTALLQWAVPSARALSDEAIADVLNLSISEVDIWGRRPGDSKAVVAMLPSTTVRRLQLSQRVGKVGALEVAQVLLEDVEGVIAQQAATHRPQWTASMNIEVTAVNMTSESNTQKQQLPEFFDDYRDLESVYAYLEQLALEHPHLARFIPSIGNSYEGRPIPAIEVSPCARPCGGCSETVSHGQGGRLVDLTQGVNCRLAAGRMGLRCTCRRRRTHANGSPLQAQWRWSWSC